MSVPDPLVIRGNALALPLADNSVDLVITSPPYFALRSYQDAGEHYAGQIGSEATPAEFVDALIAATREMVRVVKPSGSIWVNLGDKYAGYAGDTGGKGKRVGTDGYHYRAGKSDVPRSVAATTSYEWGGVRGKSLMGVPWRYALRCIDDLGLILRAEVIWSKPNGLPESVTDRVRRSHEYWFHFTREPRYYSAVDEIREAHVRGPRPNEVRGDPGGGFRIPDRQDMGRKVSEFNPLGKLPGSVWTIPTEPLKVPKWYGVVGGKTRAFLWTDAEARAWMLRTGVRNGRPSVRPMTDHFAAFPMEWPRRIIQGWSPSGVCTACGEGRRPVADKGLAVLERGDVGSRGSKFDGTQQWHEHNRYGQDKVYGRSEVTITGYACACSQTGSGAALPVRRDGEGGLAAAPLPPTRPAVVLDPFGGTGTTALVAKALGRRGISVDMSADYCRLARWRTTDEGEYARALQVPKPAKQAEGQTSLFDMLDGTDG